MILSQYETPERYFEVMLPSRDKLARGKKQALVSLLSSPEDGAKQVQSPLGDCMIACVDADYDYLMQGATYESKYMLDNPYVVHTYAYAIENLQCYAPSLHNVCVMATLNDHSVFDFTAFLEAYSRVIFPLFVWNIMLYRRREFNRFTITEFNNIVSIRHGQIVPDNGQQTIERLRHKVRVKIGDLRRQIPNRKEEYLQTKDSLISLGVTPEQTYLYVQGHHLFDNVVLPTLDEVCLTLVKEREADIKDRSQHAVQRQNELSAYRNSVSDVEQMLKKNNNFQMAPQYILINEKIKEILK